MVGLTSRWARRTVATPAEREQFGTYPDYATLTALEVQGYDVVATEHR